MKYSARPKVGLAFARSAQFGLVVDCVIGQLALIRFLRGLTSDFVPIG